MDNETLANLDMDGHPWVRDGVDTRGFRNTAPFRLEEGITEGIDRLWCDHDRLTGWRIYVDGVAVRYTDGNGREIIDFRPFRRKWTSVNPNEVQHVS